MTALRSIAAAFVVLLLYGCQEFRGPAWSPDGQSIAYTLYTRKANGGFDTDLYIVYPDAEDPPKLIGQGATCPQWSIDDKNVYFLGARDTQGFYTKIMRYKPGADAAEVALAGVKLTGMQLAPASTGPYFLLMQGRDTQIGSPIRAELWNAGDNKRIDLSSLGEIYGPAVSYNGKVLVYGTKPADGHAVLMGLEINVGEPKAIFPTPENQEPQAAGFVVQPYPNAEKFLFYGPGLTGIWTMQGRPGAAKFLKYVLPEGVTSPVMARVSDDGNSAAITLMRPAIGKFTLESYKLDLVSRRWTKLDSAANEMIGGPAPDPKAKKLPDMRTAWLSAAGLAVGDPLKPRFMPLTASQYLAASTQALKAKDAPKALELAMKAQDLKPPPDPEALSQTLFAAYVANNAFPRAADIYEQTWLLEPVNSTGLKLFFPPESGLPQVPPEWVNAEVKKMDELIAAAPEARMVGRLKEAFQARVRGDQRVALEVYQKAVDLCADKAREAGIHFQQALCELELGEMHQAAEYFEQAAAIEDFPQSDYAAVLSAMAYSLVGRPESPVKATKMLQLPAAKKSPLAAEMAKTLAAIKGRTYKEHGSTNEDVVGASHAWAEYDVFWMPFAATKPMVLELGDGKAAQLRFGLKRYTASAIYSSRQRAPLLRLARAVSAPKLSQSGALLAFTVSGEVFPLPDSFCELFVLDAQGRVYAGNAKVAAVGGTKGRQVITDFKWASETEITLTGVDVDLYGEQKPFEKTQMVRVK